MENMEKEKRKKKKISWEFLSLPNFFFKTRFLETLERVKKYLFLILLFHRKNWIFRRVRVRIWFRFAWLCNFRKNKTRTETAWPPFEISICDTLKLWLLIKNHFRIIWYNINFARYWWFNNMNVREYILDFVSNPEFPSNGRKSFCHLHHL